MEFGCGPARREAGLARRGRKIALGSDRQGGGVFGRARTAVIASTKGSHRANTKAAGEGFRPRKHSPSAPHRKALRVGGARRSQRGRGRQKKSPRCRPWTFWRPECGRGRSHRWKEKMGQQHCTAEGAGGNSVPRNEMTLALQIFRSKLVRTSYDRGRGFDHRDICRDLNAFRPRVFFGVYNIGTGIPKLAKKSLRPRGRPR